MPDFIWGKEKYFGKFYILLRKCKSYARQLRDKEPPCHDHIKIVAPLELVTFHLFP